MYIFEALPTSKTTWLSWTKLQPKCHHPLLCGKGSNCAQTNPTAKHEYQHRSTARYFVFNFAEIAIPQTIRCTEKVLSP